jgi:hypothetical protein
MNSLASAEIRCGCLLSVEGGLQGSYRSDLALSFRSSAPDLTNVRFGAQSPKPSDDTSHRFGSNIPVAGRVMEGPDRRILLLTACSGEGPLTEPTTAVRRPAAGPAPSL